MREKIKLSDLVRQYEQKVLNPKTDLEMAIFYLIDVYKEEKKCSVLIMSSLNYLISHHTKNNYLVSLNDWSE